MRHSKQKYRGGNDTLAVKPFESYGFKYGASSAREEALRIQQVNNEEQFKLNRQSGGEGGLEVPTFAPIGGREQPYSATNLSLAGNSVLLNGKSQASGDCYVRPGGCIQGGRGRMTRKHKRSKNKRSNSKRTNKNKRSKNKRSNSKRSKHKRTNNKHSKQ